MDDQRAYVADRLELEAMQAGANAFRARALKACAAVVRGAARPFCDSAGARAVLADAVSPHMMQRIAAILDADRKELGPEAKLVSVMQELMGVTCIGQVAARRLAAAGVESLDALEAAVLEGRAAELKLTAAQELCVRHRADIAERIPRSEMHEHATRITAAAASAGCRAEVVGSYRRNAPCSGDIDVLLVGDIDAFLAKLYPGYVVGAIARGPHKFMGLVRLPDRDAARRLDVLVTTAAELPFAMLHFTGPADFNVALRKVAMSRGMRLSEKGWDAPGREPHAQRAPVSEADVLAELGVRWTEPERRCGVLAIL